MSSTAAKATIGLMLATIISKILGLVRELVLASAYGASMYSDAYIIAMNIPIIIFSGIGIAISTTFIPIYFDINSNLGEKSALKFTNNIFNIITLICIIMSFLGLIFTESLVKIFAYGFSPDTFNITVNFARILILGIVFIGASNIITAYLQAKNNFIIPGIISLPYNIIIIVSIILSIKYGYDTMVWGTLAGIASQFLFQIPFAIKKGYKYSFNIDIKDKYIKRTIWMLGPVFIGVAASQINAIIDRTLASGLSEGSISALNYANKLNGFVMALFISSIAVVIYPKLSKLSSENNKENFICSVVTSINSAILLVMPISAGAIVLSTPIVKILFQRGEFDERATSMTAIALVMYSFGMAAFGIRDILGKVFYSLQDTKTPMINGAISITINIVLNLILVKQFKHVGLAFATSLSSIICIFLLFISLKNKIGYFGQDKMLKTAFKSAMASILMGVMTYYVYKKVDILLGVGFIPNLISLVISVFTGIAVYGMSVVLLKIEEIKLLIDTIKSKLKK